MSDLDGRQDTAEGSGAGALMVGTLAFASGLLVGIATGFLIAPHSGAYTRRQIQNLAEDVKERASDLAAEARETVETVVQQGKRIVS